MTAIAESIGNRAHVYFDDFSDQDVKVSVTGLRHLKNSMICDFLVEQQHRARFVVVKTSPIGGLKNILKVKVGEDFIYEREYDVLKQTFEFLTEAGHGLKAVRPLDLLESPPSIITEKVKGVGYKKLFRRGGRFGSRRSRLAACRACELAGEWLLYFHQVDIKPAASRVEKWSNPMVAFEEIFSGLLKNVDDRNFLQKIRDTAVARLGGRKLNVDEHFTVTHGDFALRNLMWLGDGSVAVFDTLALHVEPFYLDLAYFITSLRTYWLHLITLGNFFSPSLLQTYESTFVARYKKEKPIEPPLLDFFLLYSMLDTWNAGFIHLDTSETRLSRKRRLIKQKLLEHLIRKEVFDHGS